MSYKYEVKIKAADFWRVSMYRTYHSFIGVCNIVFGIAMVLLTLRFWNQANDVIQALLFVACLLIPVIQPVGVYLKARSQVLLIPQGTELIFAEDGIHVSLNGKRELVPWNKVKKVVKEAGMVIIFTDAVHGYMLTDRVLGSDKKEFYNYVKAHINALGK